ncbi:MAG: DUF4148 domain-containing protein [Caldimonas sp.]
MPRFHVWSRSCKCFPRRERRLHELPPFPTTNDQEISMKTKLALSAVAMAVAVFSQGAFAQASSPTRAEVKAETKAAEKSGKLTPAGEGPGAMGAAPSTSSTKTRAERKAETRAAAKTGGLAPAGEGADMKADKAAAASKTTTDRAMRKAETASAAKARALTPAGEGAAVTPPK